MYYVFFNMFCINTVELYVVIYSCRSSLLSKIQAELMYHCKFKSGLFICPFNFLYMLIHFLIY